MAQEADCFNWLPDLDDPGEREAILNLEPFLDADPAFGTQTFPASTASNRPLTWMRACCKNQYPLFTKNGASSSTVVHQFADQPWLAAAWLWLTLAHNQVVTGEAIVEEALNAAQQTFDAYRVCIIARNAAFDEQEQRVCVSETDPNLARLFGW